MEDKEINLKLKECKTAEELKAFAKEIGYELTDEEAQDYFGKIQKSGELSDDELDLVSGGGCSKWRKGKCYSGNPPHHLIVTWHNRCPSYSFSKYADPKNVKFYNNRCPCCVHCVGGPGFTLYCSDRTYNDDKYNPK